jgi:hypothetical protein
MRDTSRKPQARLAEGLVLELPERKASRFCFVEESELKNSSATNLETTRFSKS